MLLNKDKMTYVDKSWGSELWICNNEKYCGKILNIKKDHFCSFHFHKLKDEVLFLFYGKMLFNYAENDSTTIKQIEMNSGDAYHVKPGLIHQMVALDDCVIIETSTQHFDSDSYRLTTQKVNPNELPLLYGICNI